MSRTHDVAIIGGGPAGSTAATLLARAGHSVIVLEKEIFPRFHIGESLLPFSLDALERMGVMPKIRKAGFVVKHGAEVASGCGVSESRFYFKDGFRSKRETAFQVERSTFDKILLDHARECGAEIREGTSVTNVTLSPGGVTIECSKGENIAAKYVIDCSGRHSVLGTKLRLKREYPDLRKIAIYAHYENVHQNEGIDGTLTRMVRARDHWFWMIPLSPDKVSVGVVMDVDLFRKEKLSPEESLLQKIEALPVMQDRMAAAVRCTKVYTSGEYSFRNTSLHGDRWLLAGDAAGFIDPVFSSGVFLAILSGETAADAVNTALAAPAKAARTFHRYARRLNKVMNLYLRFVRAWYEQEFVETLLNPQSFFDIVPAVNAVLAGNLGASFALRWRLWIFHTLVKLQRFAPVSPRLLLTPPSAPMPLHEPVIEASPVQVVP